MSKKAGPVNRLKLKAASAILILPSVERVEIISNAMGLRGFGKETPHLVLRKEVFPDGRDLHGGALSPSGALADIDLAERRTVLPPVYSLGRVSCCNVGTPAKPEGGAGQIARAAAPLG